VTYLTATAFTLSATIAARNGTQTSRQHSNRDISFLNNKPRAGLALARRAHHG